MAESSRATTAGNGKVDEKFVKICQRGSRSEIETFLEKNVSMEINRPLQNGCAPHGWPALMYACRSLNVEAISALLKYKADPEFCVNGGLTPLMAVAVASSEKNQDTALTCAKLLVEAGVRATNTSTLNGRTVLTRTVRRNAPKLTKYLVEVGANVNDRDGCGETPLNVALKMNFRALAKCLIEIGANPFVKNLNGDTSVDIVMHDATNGKNNELLSNVALWRMEYFAKNFHGDPRRLRAMVKEVNQNCKRKEVSPIHVSKSSGKSGAQESSTEGSAEIKGELGEMRGIMVNLEEFTNGDTLANFGVTQGIPESRLSSKEESVCLISKDASLSRPHREEGHNGSPHWTLLLGTALMTFVFVRCFDQMRGSRN